MQGKKQSMELDLFGATDSCLKSFLQTFYFYAPDDMILQRRKNVESVVSGREESFARARQKLTREIETLYACFGSESKRTSKVFDHLEGTKSLYDSKRNVFKTRSPLLKIPRTGYSDYKRELLLQEIESDLAFSWKPILIRSICLWYRYCSEILFLLFMYKQ